MTPLASLITLTIVLVVFFAPRFQAALGIVAAALYLTQYQLQDIAGFHFTAMRMVLLAGLLRTAMRGELSRIERNAIDLGFLAFAVVGFFIYVIHRLTLEGLVYQLGATYDVLLSYLAFRALLPNLAEVKKFLIGLTLVFLPFALSILWESSTGSNVFTLLGLAKEVPVLRDGHYRCQGSFRSPITSGTVGATFIPLFAGLVLSQKTRPLGVIGVLLGGLVMMSSRSGGPLIAAFYGLVGLAFWPLRFKMKQLRWVLGLSLAGLHLFMKAPIWYLMARLGSFTGGHAWYRAKLMDIFVVNFANWWLSGTSDPSNWVGVDENILAGEILDVTNQYAAVGMNGGLISLVLFLYLLGKCFQKLGEGMRRLRAEASPDEWLLWCLGVSLFAHLVNFLSVSYFDQVHVIWYMLLAVVASASSPVDARRKECLESRRFWTEPVYADTPAGHAL